MLIQKEMDDALVWDILAEKEKSHATSTAELGGLSDFLSAFWFLLRPTSQTFSANAANTSKCPLNSDCKRQQQLCQQPWRLQHQQCQQQLQLSPHQQLLFIQRRLHGANIKRNITKKTIFPRSLKLKLIHSDKSGRTVRRGHKVWPNNDLK